MKQTKIRRIRAIAEVVERRVMLSGTVTEFPAALAPTQADGTPDTAANMLLLTDGSVMFEANTSVNWYRLTPGSDGNYLPLPQGQQPTGYAPPAISALAPSNEGRRAGVSDVLPDGRVFIAGGEFTSLTYQSGPYAGGFITNQAEIYDPVAGTWTREDDYLSARASTPDADWHHQLQDTVSEVISPDGTVLVGDKNDPQAQTFDPNATAKANPSDESVASQQWSGYPNSALLKPEAASEESWVKLPGIGGILTCQTRSDGTQVFERFVNGQWHVDAPDSSRSRPTVQLWSEGEIGPAVLLPNGQVLFIGATGNTVLYTAPTSPTGTGTWTAGPSLQTDAQGNAIFLGDNPAAVEPNGNVLIAAGHDISNATGQIVNEAELLELNPGTGSLTTVATPEDFAHYVNGATDEYLSQTLISMLDLPNGQVLISNELSGHLFVYQPDNLGVPASTPTITSLVDNGSYFTLNGTELNGLSEGASFGDDWQMATNYPIVSLTAANGFVYYGRTFGWTNVGVQTGSTPVSTNFTLPPNLPDGSYILAVSASGVSSTGPNPSSNFLFIKMGTTVTSERIALGGNNLNLYMNGSSSPAASYSWPSPASFPEPALFSKIVVEGTAGGCTLTIDTSGGDPIPRPDPSYAYTTGGISIYGAGTGNAVKLEMVGTAVTFAGGSAFTIGSSTGPQVNMIDVQSLEFDANSGTNSIAGTNATTNNTTIPLALSVGSGAALALAQTASPDSVILQVSNLTIATSGGAPLGKFDFSNNGMLLNYANSASDPMATILSYLRSGYDGGAWDGQGIITSLWQATNASGSPQTNAVGYADSADGTGTNPVANSILLEYAVQGDLNLNGTVQFNDFALVVANYNKPAAWDTGDVTYDGTDTFSDFAIVVANYGDTV